MLQSSAYTESKKLCETHASSFSLAAQFLPEEKRNAAYALYGFCRYTDNILDSSLSQKIKEKKLRAWKKKLELEWNEGNSKNKILHAFVHTCHAHQIPKELGFALIQGLEKDLNFSEMKTFDELYEYCYCAGSIPGLLMAFACGAPKQSHPFAISLGIGMQLTNILRDIREDLKQKRIYLPQNELKRFNVSKKELNSGIVTQNFKQFMQFQIERARSYYSKAQEGIEMIPTDSRAGVQLCLAYYQEILSEIERMEYDVFTSRVFVSDTRKKEIALRLLSASPAPLSLNAIHAKK